MTITLLLGLASEWWEVNEAVLEDVLCHYYGMNFIIYYMDLQIYICMDGLGMKEYDGKIWNSEIRKKFLRVILLQFLSLCSAALWQKLNQHSNWDISMHSKFHDSLDPTLILFLSKPIQLSISRSQNSTLPILNRLTLDLFQAFQYSAVSIAQLKSSDIE